MNSTQLATLLDKLLELACPVAARLAGGRDTNGNLIPGLQARLDAIPGKIRELSFWIDLEVFAEEASSQPFPTHPTLPIKKQCDGWKE